MSRNEAILVAGLLMAGCDGAGLALLAVDDSASTGMDESVIIDVLANDIIPAGGVTLELVDRPVAGDAMILSDQRVLYVPSPGYIGADDIKYRISTAEGEVSIARVGIDVACETCLAGRNIRLRWTANAPEEMVIGYRVYSGPEEDPASMGEIGDLTAHTSWFDMEMPEAVYDAWHDLAMHLDDTACFRVTAYNDYGESDYSDAACLTIDFSNAHQRYFGLGL
jgi:hypothetical protein